MSDPKSKWKCPICKQWDRAENMIPAFRDNIPPTKASWLGKAHLKCIQKFNEIHKHEPEYSIRIYTDEGKFLGEAKPT